MQPVIKNPPPTPLLSPLPKKNLQQCHYLEEDDLEYLHSDEKWLLEKFEKLRPEERPFLQTFLQDLHRTDSFLLTATYVNDFFPKLFTLQYIEQLHRERRKVEVKSIFIATIIRELLLRTETTFMMEQSRSEFLEKYSFLKAQEGTDIELTWLNRYERALRYLLPLMSPVGNKQYFHTVGTHLQGSDIFVEYITGGANRPETQRRVDLFEALTNVKPKPRAPKNMKKLTINLENEVKRGRGRPRKIPIPSPTSPQNTMTSSITHSSSSCESVSLKKVPSFRERQTMHMEIDQDTHIAESLQRQQEPPFTNNAAALEIRSGSADDEIYNLTDEEFFHHIMSFDEETTTDMDLVAGGDDISVRTPILYSDQRQQNTGTTTATSGVASYFSFEFLDSKYSLQSFEEFNDPNSISIMQYSDSVLNSESNCLDSPTVDDADIIGKKRTLSLHDILLEDEDLEFLLAMDADDEGGCETVSPNRNHFMKSPTQQHKRLIALHRSRGFSKIPVHETLPITTMPQGEAHEFPNRSIISYRFNIASVSSQDSTDVSTVSSVEPDDFEEDEIINDIDACFEGLILKN